MSRYTDRAAAVVAYLITALDGDYYYVTDNVSEATATGSHKRKIVCRWMGMVNDEETGLSNPSADRQRFVILGVPVATTDDAASDECDTIAEDIADAIRATRSQKVLGGVSLGWTVTRIDKGPNRLGGLVVEVEVMALVEEASPTPFAWGEILGGIFFGVLTEGSVSPTEYVFLTNPGTGKVTITSITAPAGFEITGASTEIEAGTAGSFNVTCSGISVAGTYTGNITIITNVGTLLYPVLAVVEEGGM